MDNHLPGATAKTLRNSPWPPSAQNRFSDGAEAPWICTTSPAKRPVDRGHEAIDGLADAHSAHRPDGSQVARDRRFHGQVGEAEDHGRRTDLAHDPRDLQHY